MNITLRSQRTTLGILCLGMLIAALGISSSASAAVTSPTPQAKVTFTFDDGYIGAVNKAAPALAAHGFAGTSYVTTSSVGKAGYMTWPQITKLKNTYNWEIASHTVSHPFLTEVTASKLENELLNSKATLGSRGFNAKAFATPYGDYNNNVMAGVARHYASHRPFADVEHTNGWPYNDYLLYVKQVQMGVTVEQVKAYIDEAKRENSWLILVFHEISDTPEPNPEEYEYSTADLSQIAAYVKSQNLPVVSMSDGLVTSDTNMLANGTFDNGIADGWTTDAPASVKKNTARKGSYPNPINSIQFTAAANKSVHLFSPKVDVNSTKTYMLKTFLNVTALNSGEVLFYIDEYDQAGNWISGQWKAEEPSVFVENMNFAYQPTSPEVKKASLQIAVAGGSGIKAFVDTVQWFALN